MLGRTQRAAGRRIAPRRRACGAGSVGPRSRRPAAPSGTAQACAGRRAATAPPMPPRGSAAAGGREKGADGGRLGKKRPHKRPAVRARPLPSRLAYSAARAAPARAGGYDRVRRVRPHVRAAQEQVAALLRLVQGPGGKRGGTGAPYAVQKVRGRVPDDEPLVPLLLGPVPRGEARGRPRPSGARPGPGRRDGRVQHVRQAVPGAEPLRPLLLGRMPKGGVRAARRRAAPADDSWPGAGYGRVPRLRPPARRRPGARHPPVVLLGRLPRGRPARQQPRGDAPAHGRSDEARRAGGAHARDALPPPGRGRRGPRKARAVRAVRHGVCDDRAQRPVLLGAVPKEGGLGARPAPPRAGRPAGDGQVPLLLGRV